MKAIQMNKTGAPEVLQLIDVEVPEPGEGQLLIEVSAAGINFADTQMRAGTYFMQLPLPAIPGSEVTGIVVKLGEGVDEPAVGTRVTVPMFAAGSYTGGYAEYAVADASVAIPIPDGVDDAQALALLGQGLTAYYLLRLVAPPKDKSVLIHAAAGGIGTLLIQLAKLMGAAQVIATASNESKLELTRSLGADVAINYTEDGWVEHVKQATQGSGADTVLESVGGEIAEQSFQALAAFGRMVSYGSLSFVNRRMTVQDLLVQLGTYNQSLASFNLPAILAEQAELTRQGVQELLHYVANGKLKIIVGGSYPLADAAAAHRAMEARQTTGKLVLTTSFVDQSG